MRRKLQNAVLRGKIYAVDLYDGIGGMARFHVQASDEKGALHAALKMIINNMIRQGAKSILLIIFIHS